MPGTVTCTSNVVRYMFGLVTSACLCQACSVLSCRCSSDRRGTIPAVLRRFSAAMLNPRLRAMYSRGSMGAPEQSEPQLGDPPSKQVVPAKPSPPPVMSAPQNITQWHRQSALQLVMLMLDKGCYTMTVIAGSIADYAMAS